MFCVSKKLFMFISIFLLTVFTLFALNTFNKNKITKNSEASNFLCRGKLELINGKLFYPKETCCNNTTNDNICFESFIGGKHYSLNCQTKEFTRSNCSNKKIGDVIKKTPTPTYIPKKIPTPTRKLILTPKPTLIPTKVVNIKYVFNVSLNKETNTSYILEMDQLNNGQQNHYKIYFSTVEDNNCYYGYVSIQNLFKDSEKYGLPIRNAVLYFSNDNGFKIKVKDYMTDKYIFTSTIPSSSFNGFIRIYSNLFASAQCYN